MLMALTSVFPLVKPSTSALEGHLQVFFARHLEPWLCPKSAAHCLHAIAVSRANVNGTRLAQPLVHPRERGSHRRSLSLLAIHRQPSSLTGKPLRPSHHPSLQDERYGSAEQSTGGPQVTERQSHVDDEKEYSRETGPRSLSKKYKSFSNLAVLTAAGEAIWLIKRSFQSLTTRRSSGLVATSKQHYLTKAKRRR